MVNSGATLIRGLKKALEGLSRVSSYIDDIVVYDDNWEENVRKLQELFVGCRKLRSQPDLLRAG